MLFESCMLSWLASWLTAHGQSASILHNPVFIYHRIRAIGKLRERLSSPAGCYDDAAITSICTMYMTARSTGDLQEEGFHSQGLKRILEIRQVLPSTPPRQQFVISIVRAAVAAMNMQVSIRFSIVVRFLRYGAAYLRPSSL